MHPRRDEDILRTLRRVRDHADTFIVDVVGGAGAAVHVGEDAFIADAVVAVGAAADVAEESVAAC